MSHRRTSEKTPVKTEELLSSAPPKLKILNHTRKSQKINTEDAISRLGSGIRILIALTEKESQTNRELRKAIGLHHDTIKDWTERLAKTGLIEKAPNSKGWILTSHKPLTAKVKGALTHALIRKKVNEALKELRSERRANITYWDVSHITRLPPRIIENDTHLLAPDYGLTVADKSSWRKAEISVVGSDGIVDETSLRRPRRTPSMENP